MPYRPLLYIIVILNIKVVSQVNCDSIKYTSDTLAVFNNEIFTGPCAYQTKRKIIKNYFTTGFLDSVIYLDKRGKIKSAETYCENYSTNRLYFKNGLLKMSINFKNDKYFGYWREYYKNGKIKYEAEYVENEELKDESYYTWDKKERKYLHALIDKSKTKKIGKLRFDSSYRHWKKTLIKNDR
jgi:antitoxin component YwqK of YwqJK toxin-antitoxin module